MVLCKTNELACRRNVVAEIKNPPISRCEDGSTSSEHKWKTIFCIQRQRIFAYKYDFHYDLQHRIKPEMNQFMCARLCVRVCVHVLVGWLVGWSRDKMRLCVDCSLGCIQFQLIAI